jgi:hypothetical protein
MPAIPAAPSSSDVAAFNNLMNPTTAQTPMGQAMVMVESEVISAKYETEVKQPIEKKERLNEEVEAQEIAVQHVEVQHAEKRDEVNNGLQTAAKISNS